MPLFQTEKGYFILASLASMVSGFFLSKSQADFISAQPFAVEHQFFGSLDQRFNGIKSLDQGGSHRDGGIEQPGLNGYIGFSHQQP